MFLNLTQVPRLEDCHSHAFCEILSIPPKLHEQTPYNEIRKQNLTFIEYVLCARRYFRHFLHTHFFGIF